MIKRFAFVSVLLFASSTSAFAQDAPVTACDTYAASDQDPQRKAVGVPFDNVDPALAVPACEAAVRQYPNSARLFFQLARAYRKADNLSAEFGANRRAAELGYAAAQTNLGSMYVNGQGVPQDYNKAIAWYRKAAEQGFATAQYNLGVIYEKGQGVPQNIWQAIEWYRKAAEQGLAPAQSRLAQLSTRLPPLLVNPSPKQELDNVAACEGKLSYGGSQVKSCEDAIREHPNDLHLIFLLGRAYQREAGNNEKAVQQFRNAAEQGYAEAQYTVGVIYENGQQGIPRNISQAIEWYRKAAEQGLDAAQKALSRLTQELTADDEARIYSQRDDLQKEMNSLLHEAANSVTQKTPLTSFQIKSRIDEAQRNINALAITPGIRVQNWSCVVDDVATAQVHDQGYFPNYSGSSAQWRTIGTISCHFRTTDMLVSVFSAPGINGQYPDIENEPQFKALAAIKQGTTLHFDGRAYSDGHTMCFPAHRLPATEVELLTGLHRCDQFELLELR